ncbi:Uncharacterized protein, contains caspase domain [Cribrihabitans marinus]|uniref:Uncharacterized protein, contains caspase domain n=1 Tax=Cribrihabitans marinus TaxID=1227549 RepID=A0A1H6VZ97_9RHOB|nr:caspase family protein [Cribrihabitans marinus]GGH25106.1 hypothetical protein GCM10010973_12050 [Cribrihabitans marinus]SEJ08424.1 Uncharacterized protein, contains caspase domain [Cribrihabitans marinus]
MRMFAAALFILTALPALAQERLALVIGNDSYDHVPRLDKAVADARAIASKLRGMGFETLEGIDVDRRMMNRRISEFTARLEPGDTAFVFFAGHGVEIDGENYLLPTDIVAPDSGESDFVKSESIALSALLDRVRSTGARTAITIVDACRNNPFETVAGRSIGRTRGLGRISAPQGTFVIFSAGAGQLALDGLHEEDPAQNSVFTRALLPRLSEPGLELRALVADLRVEVRDLARTVSHTQVPAYYDELLGEFYFIPAAAKAPATAAPAQAAEVDPIRADLELARSIGTVDALDGFLDRYEDRADEYSYQVAVQLREGLSTEAAAPAKRATQVDEVPAEPAAVSVPYAEVIEEERRQQGTKATIRATQAALNAAGCSAGGADGVIGPRTRSAFARFIDASGASLNPDGLGSVDALRAIEAAGRNVCKPAPRQAPQSASATAPAAGGLTLSGSWKYRANCVLVVKVTGTVTFRKSGANAYHGRLADSLGQRANSDVYLNSREITGTDYFPGVTVKWRGRMAADGQSYTATGSTGCSVYAWRAG